MMDDGLLVSSLLAQAACNHPDTEIVSRLCDGTIHRYDYLRCEIRAKNLARAMHALGVRPGDRVATLAWNDFRHVELFYGICGIGAVCHTLNPRLPKEQLRYIAAHSQFRVLFLDPSLVEIAEALAASLDGFRQYIILCEKEAMPATTLPGAVSYEDLLASNAGPFDWPAFDERSASTLCYTSGTTGAPKGVLHSHRSLVLSAFVNCMTDVFRYSMHDAVCPVTPMFHGNSWGSPFAAAMAGAKLVLPGPDVSGPALHRLMETEGVTMTLGVPTVWIGLLDHVQRNDLCFSTLRRLLTGGTAPPLSMLHAFDRLGVEVIHAWGMTEISPTGTLSSPTPKMASLDTETQDRFRLKQGHAIYGVQRKLIGLDGKPVAHDGDSPGQLLVRGPLVAARYFNGSDDDAAFDAEGWLRTGDVATIDEYGYMTLVDRSKDLIKSGGEWISSIGIESEAMNHPDIKEAATIGVAHARWGERPLLIVTVQRGRPFDKSQILSYLSQRLAKWQVPDDVVLLEKFPYTATGKINKVALREMYREHAPG